MVTKLPASEVVLEVLVAVLVAVLEVRELTVLVAVRNVVRWRGRQMVAVEWSREGSVVVAVVFCSELFLG